MFLSKITEKTPLGEVKVPVKEEDKDKVKEVEVVLKKPDGTEEKKVFKPEEVPPTKNVLKEFPVDLPVVVDEVIIKVVKK